MNRAFVLAARPAGHPTAASFRLVESPAPEPAEGQVLVRHHYLSVDPYMRGRMDEARSYAPPQAVGAVMVGGTVGEVVASRNPGFAVGDIVVGGGGWQLYGLGDGKELRKVGEAGLPLSTHLGVVGMPGITAWYGINHIVRPRAGETVVVSAATGAVGSVAGQLARLAGARVVGIAGGPEKCRHAVADLGYDACLDHRAPDFAETLAAALPKGIDGLFENVGGTPFQLAMRRLNPFARVAICGLIASYNGAPTVLPDMRVILVMRVRMQGFIVSEHMELWPEAIAELQGHVKAGRLVYRETVAQGLEAAPAAFLDLFQGRNLGKQVVKLV